MYHRPKIIVDILGNAIFDSDLLVYFIHRPRIALRLHSLVITPGYIDYYLSDYLLHLYIWFYWTYSECSDYAALMCQINQKQFNNLMNKISVPLIDRYVTNGLIFRTYLNIWHGNIHCILWKTIYILEHFSVNARKWCKCAYSLFGLLGNLVFIPNIPFKKAENERMTRLRRFLVSLRCCMLRSNI